MPIFQVFFCDAELSYEVSGRFFKLLILIYRVCLEKVFVNDYTTACGCCCLVLE
jgi:hypothetical protein